MLYSKLFGKTSKTFAEESNISTRYLIQGGFIRESVAGRFFILPLGWRVMEKLSKIIKEEIDAIGGQEMIAPTLHPLELWKETNRTNTAGFELMKVTDRRGAEFALGGTAEEMFVDVVRKFNLSYRDLPFSIYQFSTKFRDEMRARGGLLRVREFIMKDAYSFDTDATTFKKTYQAYWDAYTRIYQRLGLQTYVVQSDNGYIGGEYCHEYVVESEAGESKFLLTEDGTYAAHEDVAKFIKEDKNSTEEMGEVYEVQTKRGTTMEDAAKFHNLPVWQQMKNVLYKDEKGRFIMASIRGDLDVNETKLKHVAKVLSLEMATEEEVANRIHSYRGFISPYQIRDRIEKDVELILVGDDSVRTIRNTYIGTNRNQVDAMNVNLGRDFTFDIEGDIALATAGHRTPDGKTLIEKKGIEVGNIFQLGLHYTTLMKDAEYVDETGAKKPYYMGCYGIGIGRTLATIIEIHHDDRGIIWPESVAPYRYHLVGLDLQDEGVKSKVEQFYHALRAKYGDEVLYDDRVETRAGAKFADADLLGCPWRLVVSKKSGDKIEVKRRGEKEAKLVSLEEI